MSDLVAFLRARLDEDEQAAHEAATEGGHWSQQAIGVGRRRLIHYVGASPDPHVVRSDSEVARGNHAQIARHIARHDPARVLREVEADRRIIERYEQMKADGESHWYLIYETLKLRALPHADHPDYDESWRP